MSYFDGDGTFNGEAGEDHVGYMRKGDPTSNDGDGADWISQLLSVGTFNGGNGADSVVKEMKGSAVFNGQAGDDLRREAHGRTLHGGADGRAGDDETMSVRGGSFDGGPDNDTVGRYNSGSGGTCSNVESTSGCPSA